MSKTQQEADAVLRRFGVAAVQDGTGEKLTGSHGSTTQPLKDY